MIEIGNVTSDVTPYPYLLSLSLTLMMNDLFLQAAGLFAIFTAIGHGYLGDQTLGRQLGGTQREINFTRGRHFGWVMLALIVLFAWLSL